MLSRTHVTPLRATNNLEEPADIGGSGDTLELLLDLLPLIDKVKFRATLVLKCVELLNKMKLRLELDHFLIIWFDLVWFSSAKLNQLMA